MGLIYADITLANASKPQLRPMSVRALVDTGAVHLCIPEHVALQLDLDTFEERAVEVADGAVRRRRYVGPVQVRFENRQCLTGAMVLGNEVLLGIIPMMDMDVVIHLARQTLMVNPASPNLAVSKAK
jgi:clan AA aspartic protease